MQVFDNYHERTRSRVGRKELWPAPSELNNDGQRSAAVERVVRQRDSRGGRKGIDRALDIGS